MYPAFLNAQNLFKMHFYISIILLWTDKGLEKENMKHYFIQLFKMSYYMYGILFLKY